MQEYLYYKNNMSVMEKQEQEQKRIKNELKLQVQREFLKKSAPKSKLSCSTSGGSISEVIGYSSNVQAAVDYANRQLQQKIKSEMIAKMEKLQTGNANTRSKSVRSNGEMMAHDSDDELNETDKLQIVIDSIWDKYDADNSGSLDQNEARSFVKDILGGLGGTGENSFSEPVFQALFESFDEDKSGTLEKDEILSFITKLMSE